MWIASCIFILFSLKCTQMRPPYPPVTNCPHAHAPTRMYITNANTDLLPHLSEAHSIDTHPLARKPRTVPARIRLTTAHMPMRTHTPSPAPTDHDVAFITSSTYVSLDLGWVMILCFSYRTSCTYRYSYQQLDYGWPI
jgi:hypothetical protein